MIEFILERYNYWITIMLMMTGLYIVFSRGNLVKTLIGLNLFQTSVFIFYITIGKIHGGTAPILPEKSGAEDHGGEEHGVGASVQKVVHEADQAHDVAPSLGADNSLADVIADDHGGAATSSLHKMPDGADEAGPNSLLGSTGVVEAPARLDDLHEVPEVAASEPPVDAHDGIAEATAHASDIIYTNPLPHVLILTAIVVGVATTAVGLALAVRIREAYGSIEEDELEAADHLAEFGVPIGSGDVG